MTIGINCIQLDPDYLAGENTYTYGLIGGFAKLKTEHDFIIIAKNSNKHLFEQYVSLDSFSLFIYDEQTLQERISWNISGKVLRSGSKSLFRFFQSFLFKKLIKRIDSLCDIIYTPTTIQFFYNNKRTSVLSMHDIQFVHFPEFFQKQDLVNMKVLFNLSAESVDYIQASSEFIKRDLLQHFSVLKKEQVFVIPEGVDIDRFSAETDTGYLGKKYNIPDDFLFFPAQLWKHKNHITVLKALQRLKKDKGREIPLILTGTKYSGSDEIFDFIEKNELKQVYHLGKVPFDDLIALYQSARIFITAVLYESSSLPILEATAAGTPVIASQTPPNEEMSQILELNLFPPTDHIKLSELIHDVWNNEELLKVQIEKNSKKIAYYSWENAAKRYIEFFERIT